MTSEIDHRVKLVTAIVSVFKLDGVCAALEQAGVRGMTLTEVRGVGHQGSIQVYRGALYRFNSVPKIRLDIAVPDEIVEPVIAAILGAARTGRVGDGKIMLVDLDQVVRIRDGQRGNAAL